MKVRVAYGIFGVFGGIGLVHFFPSLGYWDESYFWVE